MVEMAVIVQSPVEIIRPIALRGILGLAAELTGLALDEPTGHPAVSFVLSEHLVDRLGNGRPTPLALVLRVKINIRNKARLIGDGYRAD
jgi:hypothetical protein